MSRLFHQNALLGLALAMGPAAFGFASLSRSKRGKPAIQLDLMRDKPEPVPTSRVYSADSMERIEAALNKRLRRYDKAMRDALTSWAHNSAHNTNWKLYPIHNRSKPQ